MTGAIRSYLQQQASQGKSALIPFIVAGHGGLEKTASVIRLFDRLGLGMMELGLPFSDPVADGPVIQAAHEDALSRGTRIDDVFKMIQSLRLEGVRIRICLFSYYNPLLAYGLERLVQDACHVGVQALLVVDLPPDYAQNLRSCAAKHDLELVFLLAPTTSFQRIPLIDQAATGAVYVVSRLGITGAQQEISALIKNKLAEVSGQVSAPVILGFGLSTPQQIQDLQGHAAGLVVGSKIVGLISEQRDIEPFLRQLMLC